MIKSIKVFSRALLAKVILWSAKYVTLKIIFGILAEVQPADLDDLIMKGRSLNIHGLTKIQI